MWLSGLSTGLWTKGSLVWFPVRAHVWVAGQVPSRGCTRGNHTLMLLSLSPSLPLCLKINKIFKIFLIIWMLIMLITWIFFSQSYFNKNLTVEIIHSKNWIRALLTASSNTVSIKAVLLVSLEKKIQMNSIYILHPIA